MFWSYRHRIFPSGMTKPFIFQSVFVVLLMFEVRAESPRKSYDVLLNLVEVSWKYTQTNPDTAIILSLQGIEISKRQGHLQLESRFLSNMAEAHRTKGNYSMAIELLLESISIYEKISDAPGQASTLNRMGAVYLEMGQIDTAIDYFMRALVKYESLRDLVGSSRSLNNLGACYFYEGDFRKAIDFFSRSLDVELLNNNKNGVCDSYVNIGSALFGLDEFSQAESYFMKALKLAEELKDSSTIGSLYNNMATLKMEQGDYKNAISYFHNALDLAYKSDNNENIRQFLLNIANAYEKSGEYRLAFENLRVYIGFRDSTLNEQNQHAIAEMTTKYKSEQKEKENQLLKKNGQIKDLELDKQKAILYGVSAALLLMAVLGLLIWRQYRQKIKANTILQEQRDTIAAQKKDLTDSIVYARHLQDAILPETNRLSHFFTEHFLIYLPKDIVSGDFFWLMETEEDLYLAVADCTGHGVPGAMVSMVCHNALNRSVSEFGIKETNRILDKCAELIEQTFSANRQSMKDGMDISLMRLTKEPGKIQWSGANNPFWIIRKGEVEVESLKPNPQPIGSFFGRSPFHAHECLLNTGDCIYLFTDGIVDQFGGPNGKKLKAVGLKKILLQFHHLPHEEQRLQVMSAFENWKGDVEQIDDVCLVGIRV